MKNISATWEKRNLGVEVREITCEGNEDPKDLKKAIDDINEPYSVLKIPCHRQDLLLCAQEGGYYFSETLFSLSCNLKNMQIPPLYSRFLSKVRTLEATEDIKYQVLQEIREGAIYDTDRIALDPHFSKKIAGERYYNWCKDVLAQGAIMEAAYYNDKLTAFNVSIFKDKDRGILDGILGAVLPEAESRGLGFLVLYSEMQTAERHGGKTILGRVSSNNPSSLRLHLQFGYEIRNIDYVLIKHK